MNVIIDGVEYKPVENKIPEGFTRHDGGDCPVDGGIKVEIIYSDNTLSDGYSDNFFWNTKYRGDRFSIIAYRIHKPTVMVELLEDDVRHWAGYCQYSPSVHDPSTNLYAACQEKVKALEGK